MNGKTFKLLWFEMVQPAQPQPKDNFVKLNPDGACKDQHVAGCGGIVRGSQGEWIGGFAKCLGSCSAFVAEIWGVLVGLHYARSLGFSKVELTVDSEAVWSKGLR
jgi:ribonuclease HI